MSRGNVIVTGNQGFIGSCLHNKLSKLGKVVRGIDLKDGEDVNQIKHMVKDDVDIIYHLAAQSRVQTSFDDPEGSVFQNVHVTQQVLEFANERGAKVVFAGSSSRYVGPYSSPYAASKFMAEQLCKMYRNCYGVDVEIARFWNVYGEGESLDPVHGNLIGIWRYNIENGLPCKIVGDGEQRRDFINVSDICEGLIHIGDSDEHREDAWDMGTGWFYSVNDIAGFFKERYPDAVFEYVEDRKGNFKKTFRAGPEMLHTFGWEPQDKVRDYILNL